MIPDGVFDVEVCDWRASRNVADDRESGTIVAMFRTVDGSVRNAVDMDGYGALQFFTEEEPAFTLTRQGAA
jgi:hypothetical protein